MKEIYLEYARFNHWANQRTVEVLASLREAQAEQYIESSFPSVKRTVLHIWDAETIWLTRLRGLPIREFPSKYFQGDFPAACAGWLATSADLLAHVEGLAEADFNQEMSFRTITSGDFSHRVSEMVHHCLNHSTHHRGQLVTFARQLGLRDLPSTDLIFYLREKNKT